MQKDFEYFFYEAEDHYLNSQEMITFKQQVCQLKQRLDLYKELRSQEIVIFQLVADHLVKKFADEPSQRLEKALTHWISVMRYSGMAMLLNNSDYLRHRLLEWLTDMIHAQEMVAIETYLFQCLQEKLGKSFSSDELELLMPFPMQAQTMLLESNQKIETVSLGE